MQESSSPGKVLVWGFVGAFLVRLEMLEHDYGCTRTDSRRAFSLNGQSYSVFNGPDHNSACSGPSGYPNPLRFGSCELAEIT